MSTKRFFKNAKKNTPGSEKKNQSPSNSRSITEAFNLSLPKINSIKLLRLYGFALKTFVGLIFILAIIVVGLDFKNNLQTKQKIDSQRKALNSDLKFWEDFISKNQGYRDAYLQASILEYKLGNIFKAKKYVEKGLSLDPNSKDGKKLEKVLSK